MPPAAAVPPYPAQNATEDSNTVSHVLVSGLLQVLDRQRENLDRIVTTAQANTAAIRENMVAISHLASYFRRMMSWINNVEQRVDALSRNQEKIIQTNAEIISRLNKLEMNQASAPYVMGSSFASAAPAFGANGSSQATAQAPQSDSTPQAFTGV